MSNKIALRPSYWASVSGGKDSLYMLNLILHNLDHIKYLKVVTLLIEVCTELNEKYGFDDATEEEVQNNGLC